MQVLNQIKPSSAFFRNNRLRLLEGLSKKVNFTSNSCILLRGQAIHYVYDDDQAYNFIQDQHFWWATGVDQPGAYSLINKNGDVTIYTPKVPETNKYWERVLELEEYLELYPIDGAKFLDTLQADMKELNIDTVFILGGGVNKYSGVGPLAPAFDWLRYFTVNNTALYPTINEVKLFKSEEEITLLKAAAKIGSDAHIFVLQNVKPGMNESHIQTLFKFNSMFFDCNAQVPYEEIIASGTNASVLHYHKNNRRVLNGDMVLMDAGAKINGYCSDITSTFPINGKFSQKQKEIYEVNLEAFNQVRANAKAGVHWQELQNLAEKSILEGLLRLGLVKGGSLEELWEKRVSYYFLPHGIGHYIGTYVHDLLGDPAKENEKKHIPQQNIRVHRKLEKGMVLTNEPGVYFIERLLSVAKKDEKVAQFFDFEKIAEYSKEISGVRIEEMIIIHEDRAESIIDLPRTVEQIEKCMAKQAWN